MKKVVKDAGVVAKEAAAKVADEVKEAPKSVRKAAEEVKKL